MEAIIDYDESLAMIEKALNLILMANQTLSSTQADIDALLNGSLAATAESLLNTSMELLSEAEMLYDTIVMELLPDVEGAREAYERAKNQTQEITDLAIMLHHDVNVLTYAVSTHEVNLNRNLTLIQDKLNVVNTIYESVTSVEPILEQNITRSQMQLDQIQRVYMNLYTTIILLLQRITLYR